MVQPESIRWALGRGPGGLRARRWCRRGGCRRGVGRLRRAGIRRCAGVGRCAAQGSIRPGCQNCAARGHRCRWRGTCLGSVRWRRGTATRQPRRGQQPEDRCRDRQDSAGHQALHPRSLRARRRVSNKGMRPARRIARRMLGQGRFDEGAVEAAASPPRPPVWAQPLVSCATARTTTRPSAELRMRGAGAPDRAHLELQHSCCWAAFRCGASGVV